jgi:hypothetical protein
MAKANVATKSKASLAQRLFDKAGAVAVRLQKSTVASRKAEAAAKMAALDLEFIADMQDKLGGFMDLATLVVSDGTTLTENNAHVLMTQALVRRDIAEFMDVVNAAIKETAFLHLDTEFAAQGEEDPSSINGSIDVPSMGKRFAREGAGYNDPTVDEAALAAALGDRIGEVYEEKVVRTLSMDKLMDLVEKDPSVMEAVRDSLIPGTPKTARLVIRDL